jgi:hypothetical protein
MSIANITKDAGTPDPELRQVPPKPADSQDRFTAAGLDAISEQIQQVRAAASTLLDKPNGASSITDMASAVEKAAGALKIAAEMGKTRTELVKVNEEISKLKHDNETASKRERSEGKHKLLTALAPWVTVVVTVITASVTFWQFLRSERDKREEALDAQWQNTIKNISESEKLSPSAIALQQFLGSPKYHEQATNVVVKLLSRSSDLPLFKELFSTALAPVNWSNIGRVLELDRTFYPRISPLWTKAWNGEKKQKDLSRLTEEAGVFWRTASASRRVPCENRC